MSASIEIANTDEAAGIAYEISYQLDFIAQNLRELSVNGGKIHTGIAPLIEAISDQCQALGLGLEESNLIPAKQGAEGAL